MFGHLRVITTLLLEVLATLALSGYASPTPPVTLPASPPSYEDLARHYAPVIRKGVITDQDYITAVDFDGDWSRFPTPCNGWNSCRLPVVGMS